MLRTHSIPLGEFGQSTSWQYFLGKAARGSIYAAEILSDAQALFIQRLGISETDSEHFDAIYRQRLMEQFTGCAVMSLNELYDLADQNGWLIESFEPSSSPCRPAKEYIGIWGHAAVDASRLLNDSMLFCLDGWSVDHFLQCVEPADLDYDSRTVTAGMLYLSLLWPERDSQSVQNPN